jgi:hypothetical protein
MDVKHDLRVKMIKLLKHLGEETSEEMSTDQ